MSITERKEREKAERKSLIMHCAKALILEHGIEAVSMQEIAAKAELSKATLYLYFSSKEALFEELCEDAAQRFIGYYRSHCAPGMSALDSLKLYWKSYIKIFGESEDIELFFNMKHYLLPVISFPESENVSDNSKISYTVYTMIREMISAGIAEGIFESNIDAETTARVLLALFSFFVESAGHMPGEQRRERKIIAGMRDIFQIMLRGIVREGIARSTLELPLEWEAPNEFGSNKTGFD
ncbi:hypothetical protein FACS1894151_06160 [Spirochaetia bacterium]|nr:hypothetical protein FACS1894151_06160 [Spirochaetia bacterium]